MTKQTQAIPKHLSSKMRKWVTAVLAGYQLEDHHRLLLMQTAEAHDIAEQARKALREAGSLTFPDNRGVLKARPEVRIVREYTLLFEKGIRSLGLDLAAEEPNRPPATTGRGRR